MHLILHSIRYEGKQIGMYLLKMPLSESILQKELIYGVPNICASEEKQLAINPLLTRKDVLCDSLKEGQTYDCNLDSVQRTVHSGMLFIALCTAHHIFPQKNQILNFHVCTTINIPLYRLLH